LPANWSNYQAYADSEGNIYLPITTKIDLRLGQEPQDFNFTVKVSQQGVLLSGHPYPPTTYPFTPTVARAPADFIEGLQGNMDNLVTQLRISLTMQDVVVYEGLDSSSTV
jgi:hypothetical protein